MKILTEMILCAALGLALVAAPIALRAAVKLIEAIN
jgi:hypothetical protein